MNLYNEIKNVTELDKTVYYHDAVRGLNEVTDCTLRQLLDEYKADNGQEFYLKNSGVYEKTQAHLQDKLIQQCDSPEEAEVFLYNMYMYDLENNANFGQFFLTEAEAQADLEQ